MDRAGSESPLLASEDADVEPRIVSSPIATTPTRVSCFLTLSVITATMGMFALGYQIGVMNEPELVIEAWINRVYAERGYVWNRTDNGYTYQEKGMSPRGVRLYFAIIVASFMAGGTIGAVLSGGLANRIGRKPTMMLSSILGIVGGLLMGAADCASAPEFLIAGRVLLGLCTAAASVVSPMYLMEISPTSIRGAIGMCNQVAAVTGLLLSQVLGFHQFLATAQLWPYLFAVGAIPLLMQLLMLFPCPESPRYLYINRNDVAAAGKVLKALRSSADIDDELSEIESERQMLQLSPSVTIVGLFRRVDLRLPLLCAIVAHLSQQLCGIGGIFSYATLIFQDAGMQASTAMYASSGIGVVLVLSALVSIPAIDRLGRKTLLEGGLVGIAICGGLTTLCLVLEDYFSWAKYAAIGTVLLFCLFFGLGPGSIPWMIVSELFSQGSRGAATSVACFINWSANFLVSLTFPLLQDLLGAYVFLPFAALTFIFAGVLWQFLPETKGRTFREISLLFQRMPLA